jgi:N-acetylmuramoyl-L-alanine amidase
MTSDTSCPAVLTENLFQDNKGEVQYLLSEEGKRNIIELHLEAIKKYINS